MINNLFDNQLFQATLTSLSAIFILVAGQIIIKFFIEPIQKQAELIGEIAHSLTYYANVFGYREAFDDIVESNSLFYQRALDAAEAFRDQASRLRATAMVIKWYRLWAFLHFVPKRNDVISASTELIGLSNSVHSKNVDPQVIHERKDKIAKALGFKIQTP